MSTYLSKVKELLDSFLGYRITQIPREDNALADSLARLASSPVRRALSSSETSSPSSSGTSGPSSSSPSVGLSLLVVDLASPRIYYNLFGALNLAKPVVVRSGFNLNQAQRGR